MIVSVHSYKGGTGKTSLSVNLVALFAKKGKRVCLIDLDFRAPSLHAIFKKRNKHWMNDYLNGTCTIENVLTEHEIEHSSSGKLLIGLANPQSKQSDK